MDILIVRHGESEGNAAERMQGRRDMPLTARGRAQARAVAGWLSALGVQWDVAYASPLSRAWETAEIITAGLSPPVSEPLLVEIGAGALEGLTREEMGQAFPSFLTRKVTDLGDFEEYGGESYAEVQARVSAFVERIQALHGSSDGCVLVVAHGGFNFQLVKRLICEPVPRVCILKMGNCSTTLVHMRERRGHYMGEVVWHVPVELMGERSADGNTRLFR